MVEVEDANILFLIVIVLVGSDRIVKPPKRVNDDRKKGEKRDQNEVAVGQIEIKSEKRRFRVEKEV